MTTDLYSRAIFSDGEGIDLTDMQSLSGTPLAVLFDQLIYELLPREAATPDLDTAFDPTTMPYAVALTVAGARPTQGSANNKIKITGGTLMQAIAARDGTEPKLLAYSFPGTDEVTIANGDPTNPRVDLVQMSLSYLNATSARDFQDAATRALTSTTPTTRRRVQCVLSVKQGTPAASPTYPTPDAGCVVVAGVVVGTNYAAAAGFTFDDLGGATAVIHDQRMPLRVRSTSTLPANYIWVDTGSEFAIVNRFIAQRMTAAFSIDIRMPCLRVGNAGRLVEVNCTYNAPTGGSSSFLERFNASVPTTGGANPLAGANFAVGSTGMSLRRTALGIFQNLHAPVAGPTVLAAANGMGAPVWSNGFRGPGPSPGQFDTTFPINGEYLALKFTSPPVGTQFAIATWHIAEGM